MDTLVAPEKTQQSASPHKRRALVAGGVALSLALAAGGWHWWTTARFIERTDDAYVRADTVTISPRVAGYIAEVAVDDNQTVRRGDVLLSLDDRHYRSEMEAARAAVAAASATLQAEQAGAATLDAQIGQQRSVIAQARAELDATRAEATRRNADVERYRQLRSLEATSAQRWEQARADTAKAQAEVARTQAALSAQTDQQEVLRRRRDQATAAIAQASAQLAGARAKFALARLDLEYTVIRAPRDGVVGQRAARPGLYVEKGTPLLALVPMREVYVIANFKETQLGAMRVGQTVRVAVDTYSGRALRGEIASLAPASGAEFALLPPDNATGNFTKIVQRVPVKIRVEPPPDIVLRPGMSVIAEVDTRDAGARP